MTDAIDAETIDNLKEIMGDGFDMVMGKFVSTSGELLKEISEAISSSDIILISRNAHSLKSSAAQVGAKKMSEICFSLEHNKDIEKAKALHKEIDVEFKNVLEELKNYIA